MQVLFVFGAVIAAMLYTSADCVKKG